MILTSGYVVAIRMYSSVPSTRCRRGYVRKRHEHRRTLASWRRIVEANRG